MEQKTNAQKLASLKKANKDAREKMAVKAGYKTAADYKAVLEGKKLPKSTTSVPPTTETKKKRVKLNPLIHIVDVLDASGSMSGDKINNAINGINGSLKDLSKVKDVIYTYTLCHFSYYDDIQMPYVKVALDKVGEVKVGTRGSTALYDAIGNTIKTIQRGLGKDEKVLINIYTDGQENDSREYSKGIISRMIDDLSTQNFTVTFIGTVNDTKGVIRDLKIHESNTLSYDGSAVGLQKSMMMNSSARVAYSASVLSGEDVSTGFYKNLNTEQ